MSDIKLTYFDSCGRAEVARLVLKLGGIDFTDCRVDKEQWAVLKPSTPKGQLPILECDGKVVCESMAVLRHAARLAGMYGRNDWEASVCDMAIECYNEVFEQIIKITFVAETDEEKAQETKSLESAMETLSKFIGTLKQGKFILGDEASVADVAIYVSMEMVAKSFPDLHCEKHEVLQNLVEDFSAIPAIDAWLAERPNTKF